MVHDGTPVSVLDDVPGLPNLVHEADLRKVQLVAEPAHMVAIDLGFHNVAGLEWWCVLRQGAKRGRALCIM